MLPHRGGSVLFPQIWLLHSLWHPHVDVILYSYTPHSTKLGILISPCPSVCPSLHSSVGRIVSTLYLLQYLPHPFHIYTSYQASSDVVLRIKVFKKIWSFGKVFKFIALTLSCFDLGFNMNWSVVWVIMGRRGISSERRRSSCSHYGNQSRGCLMRGGPLWPPTVPPLAARSSQSNPRGSGPEVLKREQGHVTSESGVSEVGVFRALQPNV